MRILDNRLGQPQIVLSHARRRLGTEQIRVVLECAEERIVRVEHLQRQVELPFLLGQIVMLHLHATPIRVSRVRLEQAQRPG